MPGDLLIWIKKFAELLGCDSRPASVAVAIEDLLAERERQRRAIAKLRGRNAELLQAGVVAHVQSSASSSRAASP